MKRKQSICLETCPESTFETGTLTLGSTGFNHSALLTCSVYPITAMYFVQFNPFIVKTEAHLVKCLFESTI